jgi:mannose-6-phosphate isomerase-like protein (cupin superfamily)
MLPMLIPPDAGDRHDVLGTSAVIKLSGRDTGGRLAVVEHRAPRDAGPPPRVHRDEDELLYVLEGTFDVVLGDLQRSVGAGTWLHVPAGTTHTTRCTSDVGHLLSVYTPGGSEEFFRDIGAIDQTDLRAVLALADRHGMTVSEPSRT